MNVFEIVMPGTWLEGISDVDERRNIESLHRLLVACVEDAAVSLAFFESSLTQFSDYESRSAIRDQDRERERVVRERLE